MRGVSKRDTALLWGQLWTPEALRGFGLATWYDAGSIGTISSAASAVTSWKDRILGNDATQGTAGARPTFQGIGNNPGRLPEIRDDGGDSLSPASTLPSFGANGRFTAICVGEVTTSATNRSFFGSSGSSSPQLVWDTGHTLSLVRNFQLVLITSAAAASTGKYHIASASSDLNYCSVSIDGVETTNSTDPGYTQPINTLLSSNGAQTYDGGVCEMILFDTRLSLADRQRCEGYCAWRWDGGVAGSLVGLLPANHPYKNMPPLIGGLRLRQPRVNSLAAGGISGTLGVTIDPFVLTSSADLLIQGTLAQTLAAFTLAAAGDIDIKGALAATIGDYALSATGTLLIKGALASTIDPFILTAMGSNPALAPTGVVNFIPMFRPRRGR